MRAAQLARFCTWRGYRSRGPALLLSVLVVVSVLAPNSGTARADASPAETDQYWLSSLGITDAWEHTRGAGVTVAVIDSGIPDGPATFEGAVRDGHDVSGIGTDDGRTPVGPSGDAEHGGWVAALLAGRGEDAGRGDDDDSGKSVTGVAPEADLLSISVGFGESGSPVDFGTQIAEAVTWAVDAGADVINLSFTTNTKDWPPQWDTAFRYAAEHDVVVVAAAGNRGDGTDVVGAPATIPGVLSVAGTDRRGRVSSESSSQGITIGVAAPSEELRGVSPNGDVVTWQGTSGAAPIVSGIVALVRAEHPTLDVADVVNRVTATAKPGPGQTRGDVNPLYGYGVVDAERAVTADVASVDDNPMGDLAEWISTYRPADSADSADSADADDASADRVAPPIRDEAAPLVPDSPSTHAQYQDSVIYGVVPVIAALGTATLVVLGAIGATRHYRRVSDQG